MDPPSLVSQVSVLEMWQFLMVGVPPSGPKVGRMAPGPEVVAVGNWKASLDESTVTEQSDGSRGGESGGIRLPSMDWVWKNGLSVGISKFIGYGDGYLFFLSD
ncbi:hypothetical protein COCNU_10G005500 [Cocos nucifera]|uniref:Uncharacterized protein n=1 Tax=Cocos nucifera TaxID=13894 RepID=A0A8K0ILC8_COCNU|nr:hypothetical protein COCNU_10G005500 [Cocos nucifera]